MGKQFQVTLPDELAASVDQAVAAGHYVSAGEAISDAVAGWAVEAEFEEPDVETLRRLWQEGVDSGHGEDARDYFRRLKEGCADKA